MITLGAPSTNSLASFNPKPVASLTALTTLILDDPAEVNSTSKSVFSASASPPAAAPAATASVRQLLAAAVSAAEAAAPVRPAVAASGYRPCRDPHPARRPAPRLRGAQEAGRGRRRVLRDPVLRREVHLPEAGGVAGARRHVRRGPPRHR